MVDEWLVPLGSSESVPSYDLRKMWKWYTKKIGSGIEQNEERTQTKGGLCNEASREMVFVNAVGGICYAGGLWFKEQ